jgi:hypothetical protein
MKSPLALAAALIVLAGCTIQIGGKTAGGRVIISAGTPTHHVISHSLAHNASGVMSRSLVHGKPHHSRATASRFARARDLSAANDITSMTYTLINTDTSAVVDSKSIDPGYPYVDLFLTPGGNYRIVIDVAITSTAPGTNVGVTRYGDQADFTVDLYYDTYVDLSVHPTQALVFDPASVAGTSAKVNVFDPSDSSTTNWSMLSTAFTAGASDKFFYGPDASLYYFNRSANAIYKWTNIGTKTAQTPMASSDKLIDGTQLGAAVGTGDIDIYAACADPWDASSLWFLGYDVDAATWNYYAVSINVASPSSSSEWDTADVGSSFIDNSSDTLADLTVVPTGIAVDSTWGDVYVTYYSKSSNDSKVYSDVLQFYGDSLFAYYPATGSSQIVDNTSSILTDVVWDQGKAWVLASPNTSLTGTSVSSNTGTADIWTFDDYLSPLATFPTVKHQVYSGSIPSLSAQTALVVPNRFTGPVQKTTLYISQADFLAVSNHVLSGVNLTTNAVTSY